MSSESSTDVVTPRARPRSRPWRLPRLLRLVDPLALVGLGALLVVWIVMAGQLGQLRLPSPSVTWQSVIDNFSSSQLLSAQGLGRGGIRAQLLPTIGRTVGGVALGALLGVAIGVAMASSRTLRLLVRPPLELLRLTPSLVAAPFLVLWFGVSPLAQIGLIVFYSFVTLQLSAYQAVNNLLPQYAQYARTLGASRRRVLWTVTLPAIVPELVGAIRVVLQLGWGLVVVSELIGAQRGLGRMMASMDAILRTDLVLGGILLIAFVAIVLDVLIKALLSRLISWSDAGLPVDRAST